MKHNICIIGGGTGGHFFPAISLAEELKSRGHNIYFVTDLRCKHYIVDNIGFRTYILNLGVVHKSLLSKINLMYRLGFAFFRSIRILKKHRIKCVIGFGGYPTFATLLAAKILKIDIIIQEQNSFLGKANKFFAKSAKAICLGFKHTTNLEEKFLNKTIFTGNLVRKNIRDVSNSSNEKEQILHKIKKTSHFTILIFGGSQGAKVFVELVPHAICIVKKAFPHLHLKVIQQVYNHDLQKITNLYKSIKIEYQLSGFFFNMASNYEEADLAITRSGASTIAELIRVACPSILVPLPHATYDHQTLNAIELKNQNAAWLMEQSCITQEKLAEQIIEIISNPELLTSTRAALKKLQLNSETIFADTVEKIINKINFT